MTMMNPMIPPGIPAVMSDALAQQVVALWRTGAPDAMLFPGIGLPSQGQGVMTMTHTMGPGAPPLTIDGLPSRSPLANNALYSCEVAGGRFLNLYEIMLPDVPGASGAPSSVQRYADAVTRLGIHVAGNHYHWTGAKMMGHFPLAIHTYSIGMDPFEFARRTMAGLQAALAPNA